MRMEQLQQSAIAVAGIGGLQFLQVTPSTPGSNIELVVRLLGQIAIAIGALYHIFKKKPDKDSSD